MTDEDEEQPGPDDSANASIGRSEAAAWGCALVGGLAFAATVGTTWLVMLGFSVDHDEGAHRVAVVIIALVSGGYALGIWARLSELPPAPGRKRRPPLWAALTGLTLFAFQVGGMLAGLAATLIDRLLAGAL